jgi:glycosyltransferase involved in cell wall biosynthesis
MLGSVDSTTRSVVAELGLTDLVNFLPWTAFAAAGSLMQSSHMLWTSLGTRKEAAMSLPSKLFEYVAAGRPILGFFPEGDAASLIRGSGTGVVFTANDPDEIIRTIDSAMVMRANGRIPFYSPDRSFLERYRIENVTARLANLLDQVVACRERSEELRQPVVRD